MDKTQLRHIFESPYSPDNWKSVMKDVFKAKVIQQQPVQLLLPSNELAESAFELGHSTTSDDRLIGFYQVNLSPKPWIEINRVGLRSLLRSIYKYEVDGALIVFVQGARWRFSFVSEIREMDENGKIITTSTEPKRYTYLLGQGEVCRTAAERFDLLQQNHYSLNDIKEAFSVEKLNKEFFKKYKEFYELFYQYLAKPENSYRHLFVKDDENETDTVQQEKPVRDFVKILLGRIVFLHFLQKKGWMGVPAGSNEWSGGDKHFIQNLFRNYPEKEKFHSKALRSLFFETLNTKRENDLVPDSLNPKSPIYSPQYKIPYLNGGLFDRDISYQHPIDFPPSYFEELLDFFEQYNFTIDENSPDDQEVGIDPEMLGHIFENLLEENREKGAFYTPKEIVHFMCQESLIEYLCNCFSQKYPDKNETEYRPLIENLIRFKKADPETILPFVATITTALDKVKICDPAIGSGAFPMGMLKEIFETRRLLNECIVPKRTFNPSQVKKEILQNSIYGVDLDIGAVEIARLRFWLSLVVDETQPQPLPNLDFKIMQGNSLLESFEGINLEKIAAVDGEDDNIIVSETGQLQLGGEFDKKIRQLTFFDQFSRESLNTLLAKYFDPDGWEKQHGEKVNKSLVKKEINELVEGKIHYLIKMEKADLEKKIKAKEEVWRQAGITDFTSLNPRSNDYRQYAGFKARYEQIDTIENILIDLQQTDAKPYFLWHLWFKDVFDKGGFDIVIGNPPYIQLQRDGGRLAEMYENQGFQTFERTGDIYSLFYEKGIQLLKNGGLLCYITSNKWMRAGYGRSTRSFFTRYNPKKLIDLGSGIFENATVDTNILIIQKSENQNRLLAADLSRSKNLYDLNTLNYLHLQHLSAESWTISSDIEQRIRQKIETRGKPLKDWDIQINYGIKTGYNEAFIIDGRKRAELIARDPRSAEIIKPLLRGRDIKRYRAEWQDLWLIATFPALKLNIDNYPAVRDYLKSFGKKLFQTGEEYIDEYGQKQKTRKKTGNKWFETQDQIGYYQDFEKEKIIYPNMTLFLPFIYDEKKYYTNQKCFIITSNKDNLKFLVGFLNSKVSHRWIRQNCPELQGGTRELSKIFFENIPIPKIPESRQRPIIQRVEKILEKKAKGEDTTALEREIDVLVYHLYELTYEEAKVIDPELRKEEFERYRIL